MGAVYSNRAYSKTMNWKRISGAIFLVGCLASTAFIWDKWKLWNVPIGSEENWCLEIGPNDLSPNSPTYWAESFPHVYRVIEWRKWSIHPGRYCENHEIPVHQIARRIATGEREEVSVIVPAKREVSKIAMTISSRIWAKNDAVLKAIHQDSVYWRILPNTYRMYWEASAETVVKRLLRENEKWWTQNRLNLATALGLTPREIVTLASIVQEETSKLDEAPRVAGLYLNRLRKGMLLQADPTLKFALGDWSIQRLLDKDKRVLSPYNTYLNPGLPPGPIRTPEPAYIDAVLQAENHRYLYMCAKPDGSGRHAFAVQYSDHLRNARAWQNMLNREQIYR